jgi:hypothetical protein
LWREAGEYAGPIFQPVSKSKGKGKFKSTNKTDERQKKIAGGATARLNKHPTTANKEAGTESVENAAVLTEDPKAVRETSAVSTGSKYTPPTANKKKRKKNKRENNRLATRVFVTSTEQEAERVRAINAAKGERRANSSSPEPGEQPAKRCRTMKDTSAKVEVAVEERNNPDDFKADGEDYTFRRLARDEDDVKDVALDLDY